MKTITQSNTKTLLISLFLAGALHTSAQAEGTQENTQTAVSQPTGPQTLVTINGQDITDLEALAFNALQGGQNRLDSQQAQVQLLNQLVNTTLLAQQAKKTGVDKLPQVVAALKMADIQVLAEAQVNTFLGQSPVTDEEIKAAYDKKYTAESLQEYKVRHILVQEEKQAKEIVDALAKGEDFTKLAKEHSVDSSKDAGGELGWIGRSQVVKPFGDALADLEKGKHSTTPVQTQFGWHVIEVVDIRTQEPPPLEQVKDQLKLQIRQQKLAQMVTELRKSADIKVEGAQQVPAATAAEKPEDPASQK
ncbi:peptidylprolyl isomerase [Thiolapillus sp.]